MLKFIIDLSVSSINEITFKYDEATYPDYSKIELITLLK